MWNLFEPFASIAVFTARTRGKRGKLKGATEWWNFREWRIKPNDEGIAGSDAHEVKLIQLISKADRSAFEVLYRAYFQRLSRFLGNAFHHSRLIEEVINETMFVVWQKADTYNHASKVSTWIFAIAYRQALKALNQSDEPVDREIEQVQESEENEPEQNLSRLQQGQLVQQAMRSLPFEQRIVVSLTYFHEMGYQEIAEMINCPVNTVKTRMFHARLKLKNMLSLHAGVTE